MIDCPECKEHIDADSIYCDQCGDGLKECPKCNSIRKGKFCTSCAGTKLIPRNESNTTVGDKPPIIETPVPTSGNDVTIRNVDNTIGKILTLSNSSVGVEVLLNDSDQIGRRVGKHKDQFVSLKQISGKHAQINFDQEKGWSVSDLGSTNGSYVNGAKVDSNQHTLLNNDTLKLANLEFNVTIK